MVVGLDLFIQHFESYTDHYVLIGGSACDWHMEQKGLPFRTTKDIDIILIVDALSDEFISHFWLFIKEGEYAIAQVGEKKQFYRFIKPQSAGFPSMIELFCRKPDLIKETEGMHLTDIPTGKEVSSLSAILLDDAYYKFALSNTQLIDGLHLANDFALICLKARAFLHNMKRKADGKEVRSDDVSKHKNDIKVVIPKDKDNTITSGLDRNFLIMVVYYIYSFGGPTTRLQPEKVLKIKIKIKNLLLIFFKKKVMNICI